MGVRRRCRSVGRLVVLFWIEVEVDSFGVEFKRCNFGIFWVGCQLSDLVWYGGGVRLVGFRGRVTGLVRMG